MPRQCATSGFSLQYPHNPRLQFIHCLVMCTPRRDCSNSSRFGKFVEVKLGAIGSAGVQGANVRNYLLERSRVTMIDDKEVGQSALGVVAVGGC